MILNLQKPVVHEAVTNPESCYWLRPSSEVRDASPAAPSVEDFASAGAAVELPPQRGPVQALEI
jgi:hypothetical protein